MGGPRGEDRSSSRRTPLRPYPSQEKDRVSDSVLHRQDYPHSIVGGCREEQWRKRRGNERKEETSGRRLVEEDKFIRMECPLKLSASLW